MTDVSPAASASTSLSQPSPAAASAHTAPANSLPGAPPPAQSATPLARDTPRTVVNSSPAASTVVRAHPVPVPKSAAALLVPASLASLPVDLTKHVVRLPISTSALIDSALSNANYEMSGVDTLATVAAALDPRTQNTAPPPNLHYSAHNVSSVSNVIASTASMDTVDSSSVNSNVNNLPVLAKSADGYVMKLVDSRSLKLVNQGGPVYVNMPKEKLMKSQLSGDLQVVRPVVNQTIKQLYAQTRSPAPKSPGASSPARSPVPHQAPPQVPHQVPPSQPPAPAQTKSPKPPEEPYISFQVLKAGDKHGGRRPVSEPPRYITQLTQNLQQQQLQQQQQQQQQQQLATSLDTAYVMRSLPSQAVQTVRITDSQRVTTVLPTGYTAQAVLPPGRNKVEYHVLTQEQLQKIERVKTEYPGSAHISKSDYVMRTVPSHVVSHATPHSAGSHVTSHHSGHVAHHGASHVASPQHVGSTGGHLSAPHAEHKLVRSLDVQTMKAVDSLAGKVGDSLGTARTPPSRRAEYTTMVNSHGVADAYTNRTEHAQHVQHVHRSTSAELARAKPAERGYARGLSVDTGLSTTSLPEPGTSPGLGAQYAKKQPARAPSAEHPVRTPSREHPHPARTPSREHPHPARTPSREHPVRTPSAEARDEKMDAELNNLLNDADKTHWGVVIFNGWLTSRELRVQPTQLDSITLASLLTMFYSDLKAELSADHLNLASLLDMRDAMDQYFRSRGHACSIVTDIRFGLANQAFDSVIAACDAESKLISIGIAKPVHQAESKMDTSCVNNPRDLLTKVWSDLKSHLRGFNVDQLRQMKKTDFLISAGEDGRLVVNHVVRNWQDIIKAPAKSGTEFKCIPFMFQNRDNPSSCPVVSFLEYSSRLCPSGVEFFQHPLLNFKYAGHVWYSCDKSTRCTLHHRDDTRTPPSSGRSTPSTSTPKNRRRPSTGKSIHPSPSPVQSPRPTSTFSDTVQSDHGDRSRTQEDGSFSPLPDISSILKQPPPLAQIHDNIYHTPVSTPASNDTPTPTPTTQVSKPKKKKKSKKSPKEERPKPASTPTDTMSQAGSTGTVAESQVSHLDDIIAEVCDKNRRDDVDADRMCLEAMSNGGGTPQRSGPVAGTSMDGGHINTPQQMAELALRSLEAAVAPANVSDAEADRMIGHVVAGLEQADRHQQAGLDMIIDYVVSSNVGEYNELYQYLADDQQPKQTFTKQRRPRNHDLTSNGSSEVMSDIDSVIDQVIQAPGYDELAAPLVEGAEWGAPLAEKRKTPDPSEQTLPPKKRKKANNMKPTFKPQPNTGFAQPSRPVQHMGQASPSQRPPGTSRQASHNAVERTYTSMAKIEVLIDEVIAKSQNWTEAMDYDDESLESEAMAALDDNLPELAALDPTKLMSGPEYMQGPSTSAFQPYPSFPSTSFTQKTRLPPVNTVMGGSPGGPTSYPGTPTYPSGGSTPTHGVSFPPPRYPMHSSAPTTPTGLGPLPGPLPNLSALGQDLPPPPPYPAASRKIPLSEVKVRLRDKVSNSLSSHPNHPTLQPVPGPVHKPHAVHKPAKSSSVHPSAANHEMPSEPTTVNTTPNTTTPDKMVNHVKPQNQQLSNQNEAMQAAANQSTEETQSAANHNPEATSRSLRSGVTPERKTNVRSLRSTGKTADTPKTVVPEPEAAPPETGKTAAKRVTPERKARESTPKIQETRTLRVDLSADTKEIKTKIAEKIAEQKADSPVTEPRRGTRSSRRNDSESHSSTKRDTTPTPEEARRSRRTSGSISETAAAVLEEPRRLRRTSGSTSTPSREMSPETSERVTRSTRRSTSGTPKTVTEATSAAATPPSTLTSTVTPSTATNTRSRRSTSAGSNSSTSTSTTPSTNTPTTTNKSSSNTASATKVITPQSTSTTSADSKKTSEKTSGDVRTTRSSGKDDKSMQLREKSQRFRQLMQRIVSDDASNNSASSS